LSPGLFQFFERDLGLGPGIHQFPVPFGGQKIADRMALLIEDFDLGFQIVQLAAQVRIESYFLHGSTPSGSHFFGRPPHI